MSYLDFGLFWNDKTGTKIFSVRQSRYILLVCVSVIFHMQAIVGVDKQRGLKKKFIDFHMASNRERPVRFYGRAFFVSAS
jgi:hypothetical protein